MNQSLTEREIEFLEHFYTPTSLTECLIPDNFNAPQTWNEDSPYFWVRPYQEVIQNFSYLYANDPLLNKKENFRIKKGAGDGYHIAARNLGKSFFLIIDTVLAIVYGVREGIVASDCAEHLKKVTEPIANFVESHKFLKIFHLRDSRANTVKRDYLTITTQKGTVIRHVNEKADTDKSPGVQYHGKHSEIRWVEEYSYASDEGEKKSIDASSSFGRIERLSGIPDVSLGSPLGKILKNPNLKNWIWRLPQLVREDWDEQTEQEKIDLYGGKNSAAYKLNVLAETIEGAFGFFDMARLQEASVNQSKRVKTFEISKEQFQGFEDRLIVEKLPGTISTWIAADIGFGAAPTEIIVLFFDGKKFKYVYNISVYRLLQKEQAKIFKFLYDKFDGAFIACDATSDEGAVIDELYSLGIPQENLLKIKFNGNVEIGFEIKKDEQGNEIVIIDKEGNPVPKLINTEFFSFQELEHLMYDGGVDIWWDEKFINQFTDIIAKQSGIRLNFGSKSVNHLVQSFQCFAVCRFLNEFNILKTKQFSKKRGFCS
jgi:hypothetical protein